MPFDLDHWLNNRDQYPDGIPIAFDVVVIAAAGEAVEAPAPDPELVKGKQ